MYQTWDFMMRRLFSNIITALNASEETYNIRPHTKNAIISAPFIIIVFQAFFLFYPATREFGLWMLRENHPIELLTFAFFVIGGIFGFSLAFKASKSGETKMVYGFYALFSMGLILVAMEEIAWGQWFFGFDTPEAWKLINLQGETTLHNISGLQGHSEIFRLIFGVGGLIGIALSFYPYFQKIGVPMLLLSWFIIITLHASVDLFNDYVVIQKHFDRGIQITSELIELFIAISAFLYVTLNARLFKTHDFKAASSDSSYDHS
jgi:hypothetical protein